MARSLLSLRACRWAWTPLAFALALPFAFADEPGCDWSSGPLDVVVHGLYHVGNIDDIWSDSFGALLTGDRDHNFRCLRLVFDVGPRVVPGLEQEYASEAKELGLKTSLPGTGVRMAPAIAFIEPRAGRDFLISRIGEPRWTVKDVATIAAAVWPRRDPAVRSALLRALRARPRSADDAADAFAALVLFAEPDDEGFIAARPGWAGERMAARLRLSMLAKLGRIDEFLAVLRAEDPAATYTTAADALLSWGYADEVCNAIGKEKNPRRADGIAGRYMMFRRGDYFPSLPRAVVAKIRKAPQVWSCFPPEVVPPKGLGPRDTSRDRSSTWKDPDIGGDE